MNSKDEELVALIARSALRDETAFKSLYDRTSSYLNGVALRIVRKPEVSNEVLQEAFVQIWHNAGTYRPHLSKPLTWLTSIVRYRSLDRLDKEKRIGQREVEGSDWLDEMTAENSPELEANVQQQVEQLRECMKSINDRARQAIMMAYLYGYSRLEIANRLNTNASTVKSWLRRGAEKLRECLKRKLVEDV